MRLAALVVLPVLALRALGRRARVAMRLGIARELGPAAAHRGT